MPDNSLTLNYRNKPILAYVGLRMCNQPYHHSPKQPMKFNRYFFRTFFLLAFSLLLSQQLAAQPRNVRLVLDSVAIERPDSANIFKLGDTVTINFGLRNLSEIDFVHTYSINPTVKVGGYILHANDGSISAPINNEILGLPKTGRFEVKATSFYKPDSGWLKIEVPILPLLFKPGGNVIVVWPTGPWVAPAQPADTVRLVIEILKPVSRKDGDGQAFFIAYPNPISDQILLQCPTDVQLVVFNALGRAIHRQSNNEPLNSSTWSSGLYLLTIQTKTGDTYTLKLLKP
jgi:hypothetical protein